MGKISQTEAASINQLALEHGLKTQKVIQLTINMVWLSAVRKRRGPHVLGVSAQSRTSGDI
jgi:hypothetical protein